MRPFLHDPVSHPDVGLHRSVGVLLLHEVDSHHSRPLVGAGLVQKFEVFLFGVRFEAEEDEGRAEVGVLLEDLEVDFVEGLHVHALVVRLHEVALLVVLAELAQQGPELHPLVAVFDVFQQHVPHVLLEDVQREHQHEEVADFLLEKHPEIVLPARHHLQLLLLQHRQVGHELHRLPLVRHLLRQLLKTYPPLLLGLLHWPYLKALAIGSKVDVGVGHDALAILNRTCDTKS